MYSEEWVSHLPLGEMRQLGLSKRPKPCTSTTPSLRSSQSTMTIECPPPDYSEVDSAAPEDRLVGHSIHHPPELRLPSNPVDGQQEAQKNLFSADVPIIQAMRKDILVLPLPSDVSFGQNVNTSSASIPTVLRSRRQGGSIERDRESNNICPDNNGSWRFGIPIADARTGAPDICWCDQCFQSGPPLDTRICFGTSDGYVEVWTDKAKAAIFSSSPSLCFCRTLPFHLETVTKYDFYRDDPQKIRDNSQKRNYLLSCRSFSISSKKDSRFRNLDSGSAQICSPSFRRSFLQPPPPRHLRQSSAPENNVHLLGPSSPSVNRTNHVIPEVRGPPKSSSDVTSRTLKSKPAQSNISINPKPLVLPKEMCWCGDCCWVTKVRRARTDQSDIRLECHSSTELGHRVFFSSPGGEIEVWTDLPKPKNAFTGVEKSTCKMAPRHVSRVVKVDTYTDRLTQSASKRVHLLNYREFSNGPTLVFDGRRAWDVSATFSFNKEDTTGKDDGWAPKDCSLHEETGRLRTHPTTREETPNRPSSGQLQPPRIGHQRRSSAPEPLGNKTEPPTRRPRYHGKLIIVRMPPGDSSSPYV